MKIIDAKRRQQQSPACATFRHDLDSIKQRRTLNSLEYEKTVNYYTIWRVYRKFILVISRLWSIFISSVAPQLPVEVLPGGLRVKRNLENTDPCCVETVVIHVKITLLMNVAGIVIQMGNLA